MKEKFIQEDTNGGIKRGKIFEVLNKKRKPDNTLPENYKNQKRIKFVVNRIISGPNRNILPVNKNNENIINYKYNLFSNNQTNNIFNKTLNNIIKPNIIHNNINKLSNNNNNSLIKYSPPGEQQTTIETNSNKTEIQEYGDYICNNENPIGSGSFGQVLYGKHKNTSLEVAVKVISSDTSTDTIRKEINFSKQLQKMIGFPTIYYTCVYDKKNIIVESLLGPSLDKLFKYCGRKFPLKTVCLIGKEIVTRLQNMHERGILHRDLKPNNLTWGNFNSSYNNITNYNYNSINNIYNKLDIKTIFLIDFGLSCSFYEGGLSYKHYKIKTNLSFVGTLRYASLNSHKGIRQSRRDDLESMIYILIYFLKGKLPWQDVKAKQKEERHKLITDIKSSVTIESLCENLPSEFAELLTYVKGLEFDEKPYYGKFYAFFHNLIEKLNRDMIEEKDYSYIWETMLVNNMMKYNEFNDESLKDEAEKLIFKGYPINLRNFTNYIIYNNRYKK